MSHCSNCPHSFDLMCMKLSGDTDAGRQCSSLPVSPESLPPGTVVQSTTAGYYSKRRLQQSKPQWSEACGFKAKFIYFNKLFNLRPVLEQNIDFFLCFSFFIFLRVDAISLKYESNKSQCYGVYSIRTSD